jgi:hypothetical protein
MHLCLSLVKLMKMVIEKVLKLQDLQQVCQLFW